MAASNSHKKSKTGQKIMLTVVTLIIISSVVFIAYYFTANKSTSKYIDALNQSKLQIDTGNNLIADAASSIGNIDVNKKDSASDVIQKLSEAEKDIEAGVDTINSINPPSKYAVQYNAFKTGAAFNLKIVQQAKLIIKNPKSKQVENAIEALNSYISQTTNNYSASKLKTAYITLPSGVISLPDKIHQYAFKMYDDYVSKSRKLEQYNSYYNSMTNVLSDITAQFTDINTNFSQIKSSNGSMQDLYVYIDSKLTKLSNVQDSYNKLSVPEKAVKTHSSIGNLLKQYISYCQNYKDTLIQYEEAGSDESQQKLIEAALNDLNAQYSSYSKQLQSITNTYNSEKTKYSDTDNL